MPEPRVWTVYEHGAGRFIASEQRDHYKQPIVVAALEDIEDMLSAAIKAIGKPSNDYAEGQAVGLVDAIDKVRALHGTARRGLPVETTHEGEYARNQREAIEHIETLPPSERSAVANRPGQTPPSTQENRHG